MSREITLRRLVVGHRASRRPRRCRMPNPLEHQNAGLPTWSALGGFRSFVGVRANGQQAASGRSRDRDVTAESRFLCRAGEHVFLDLSARSEAIFVPASGNQAL
jgi:hypothetical protein